MIDMHSHILPEMDDGSDSLETSLKMLEMLHSQGVTQVAATPHFYATKDDPEAFLRRRQESLKSLSWDDKKSPRILVGAEVAYFDGMSRCRELKKMELGDTGLLLVEMPFIEWTSRMIEELERIPLELGLTPMLAHIERYRGKKQLRKFLPELERQGVAMQCNVETFLTGKTRRWGLSMIKKGYIHFLGTDAHNLTTRAPRYAEATQVIAKKLGQEVCEELTKPL